MTTITTVTITAITTTVAITEFKTIEQQTQPIQRYNQGSHSVMFGNNSQKNNNTTNNTNHNNNISNFDSISSN